MSSHRSGAFRRQLYAELQGWLAEGLVSPEQAQSLTARYALNEALTPRFNLFTLFLYGLGFLLVGGGVIAFVAANWDGIPDTVKVIGLLTLMAFFQGVGYYWMKGTRPALGHGLLLLGAALFGANVGVFSQVFHLDGKWSGGFALWAIACTLISYTASSTPVALMGLCASAIAFFGVVFDGPPVWSVPVLVGFQALPFAIWRRSGTMLLGGLALFAASLITASGVQSGGELAMIAWHICGILFTLASFTLLSNPLSVRMGRIAQFAAILCVLSPLFLNSISFIANQTVDPGQDLHLEDGFTPLLVGLFSVLCLVWLGPALREAAKAPRMLPWLVSAIGASALAAAVILTRNESAVWLVSGLAFAIAAVALIWTGLTQRDRLVYSLGILFFGARGLALFLFYDTGLMNKAVVMVLGGVAIIVVALQYERWADRLAGSRPGDVS